jgi:hypothetical protein
MGQRMTIWHRRTALVLGYLALMSACSKAAPPAQTHTPDGAGAGTEAAAGTSGGSMVGGVGACECSNDAFCVAQEDDFLNGLKTAYESNLHYVGAECVARDRNDPRRCCFARPNVCLCYFAWGDTDARVVENAEILGNRYDACDVGDKAQGCLYRSCEFQGCDPADATSCDAACADVAARITADNAKAYDVERRSAHCDPTNCLCRAVHRIGDRCYGTRDLWAQSYDCSLSDAAIIAATYPPPDPGSAMAHQLNEDGGATVCD